MLLLCSTVRPPSVLTSCAAQPVHPPRANPKSRGASLRSPLTQKIAARRVPVRSGNRKRGHLSTTMEKAHLQNHGVTAPTGSFTLMTVKVRVLSFILSPVLHLTETGAQWANLWSEPTSCDSRIHWMRSRVCLHVLLSTALGGLGCLPIA